MKIAVLLAAGVISCCGVAHAHVPLVGYECDQVRHRLVITYRLAQGDAAEEANGPLEWNPWKLETVQDDNTIGDLRSVRGTCRIGAHDYALTIGPSPGNMNVFGTCGGEVGAWVEVRRDAAVVLPRREFEGFCHSDDPVTTRVEFGDDGAPRITVVPHAEFYGSSEQ